MLRKLFTVVAVGSVAAMVLRLLEERNDRVTVERELAGQIEALRAQLFKR